MQSRDIQRTRQGTLAGAYRWMIYLAAYLLIFVTLSLGWLDELNRSLFLFLQAINPLPVFLWNIVTLTADKDVLIFPGIALFLYFFVRDKKKGLFFAGVIGLGYLLKLVWRFIYFSPRPEDVSIYCSAPLSNSFPSGHTYMIGLFFVSWYLMSGRNRTVRSLAFILVPLVALSRVMLGCHWPMDTVGSVLLALFVFEIAKNFSKTYKIV